MSRIRKQKRDRHQLKAEFKQRAIIDAERIDEITAIGQMGNEHFDLFAAAYGNKIRGRIRYEESGNRASIETDKPMEELFAIIAIAPASIGSPVNITIRKDEEARSWAREFIATAIHMKPSSEWRETGLGMAIRTVEVGGDA